MQAKRKNWKEIIDSRRRENFVGRTDYLRELEIVNIPFST